MWACFLLLWLWQMDTNACDMPAGGCGALCMARAVEELVFRSEVAAWPLCWTAPRPEKSRGLLPVLLFSLPCQHVTEDWWPYSACPSRVRRWHLLVWLPVLFHAPLGAVARSLVIEVLCASHTLQMSPVCGLSVHSAADL